MKKLVILALSAGLFVAAASAQVPIPMTPGQALKGQAMASLGQLAQGILALANANRELDVEVVTARQAYFASVNSKPSPAVAQRFADALNKRDIHYVTYKIASDRRAGPLLKLSADIAGTGSVDGGISPYCWVTFHKWADLLISELKARGSLGPALDAAMPEFEKYNIERNLAEMLFFNPHGVLRAANPNAKEYLAAWLLGTKVEKTASAADASAARIAAQVGSARLSQVVGVIRDWTAVTDHLDGPWGDGSARSVLDPLVTGKPNPPTPADWTAQTRVFSELRGRLADPRIKLAASLVEVQKLWDSGRQNRDLATLYRAAERRDALVQEIEDASLRNLEFRNTDNGLTKSMTDLNLRFIDLGIGAIEVDMMGRGEKNARGDWVAEETRHYLAWNSKLIPRSVQAPPPRPQRVAALAPAVPAAPAQPVAQDGGVRMRRGAPGSAAPAAPAPAPASAPAASGAGSGPQLPDPNGEGVGPFDRAIILVQETGAVHISPTHLSNLLHIYANKWDVVFNNEPSPSSREYALGKVVEETQLLVRDIRQNVENRNNSFNMNASLRNDSQRRQAHDAALAPLTAVANELDARIPEMKAKMKLPAPPGAGR
jgi:hypothetical protein